MPREILIAVGVCCGLGCGACPYDPEGVKGTTKIKDQMDITQEQFDELENKCEQALKSLEFSRSWWAAREGRVSQWVRDNKDRLPEELVNEWFSIWANGTKDPAEPPTYATRLNRLEYERDWYGEVIDKAVDILDGNAAPINWRDNKQPELLRKLSEHLEAK